MFSKIKLSFENYEFDFLERETKNINIIQHDQIHDFKRTDSLSFLLFQLFSRKVGELRQILGDLMWRLCWVEYTLSSLEVKYPLLRKTKRLWIWWMNQPLDHHGWPMKILLPIQLYMNILGLNLHCKFLTGMKLSWSIQILEIFHTIKDEILLNFRRKHKELGISNPKVEVPVLLIIGGKDYFLKFPGIEDYLKIEKMREFMTDLEVVDLAEGTHFMQEQFPAQLNHLLINFLTKHNIWLTQCNNDSSFPVFFLQSILLTWTIDHFFSSNSSLM